MHLKSFQVWNFRSINDSGIIDVNDKTALLGRNESGKSNLLLALQSLNPPDGFQKLNPIKDFPRDRRLDECSDETKVLTTTWILDDSERGEIAEILPRAKDIKEVEVGRCYGKRRWIGLKGLGSFKCDDNEIKSIIRKIIPALNGRAEKLDDENKERFKSEVTNLEENIKFTSLSEWSQKAKEALQHIRKVIAELGVELTDTQDGHITKLEETANEYVNDDESQKKARQWIKEKIPVFIYLDEYPEINGHQDIGQYLHRKGEGGLTPSDINFGKLCKVAGLSPEELNELLKQNEQETRNQLTNRASAIITTEIRRLWKDRALKVRFNVDADHMDTFISDPNSVYDVEVNLNERSRGFKWFFSFYITFSADTQGGDADKAVLLLDEPGLYLHAKSQSDLLKHLYDDFKNQIIYTTHSPFMVPISCLSSVRTVNINEGRGTSVTNSPTGDEKTLFPLQAALGYDISQSLFIGQNNLVVEGVTDFWILSSISQYLHDIDDYGLSEEIILTPSGGAQKISYMVALLTSQQLVVLVLMDDEKQSRHTKDELVKSKLIKEQNVIFVTDSFDDSEPSEGDVEDLLDPDVYIKLVEESYENELSGKKLELNDKIPRIVKRVDEGFQSIGIKFNKTRPARLLINKMASEPESVVTDNTKARIKRLFTIINSKYEKLKDNQNKPFR